MNMVNSIRSRVNFKSKKLLTMQEVTIYLSIYACFDSIQFYCGEAVKLFSLNYFRAMSMCHGIWKYGDCRHDCIAVCGRYRRYGPWSAVQLLMRSMTCTMIIFYFSLTKLALFALSIDSVKRQYNSLFATQLVLFFSS